MPLTVSFALKWPVTVSIVVSWLPEPSGLRKIHEEGRGGGGAGWKTRRAARMRKTRPVQGFWTHLIFKSPTNLHREQKSRPVRHSVSSPERTSILGGARQSLPPVPGRIRAPFPSPASWQTGSSPASLDPADFFSIIAEGQAPAPERGSSVRAQRTHQRRHIIIHVGELANAV